MNSAIVDKCLDFCNGLVKSNKQFSFNLSLGKDINFNFQHKEPANGSWTRKKKSPSQLRREAKRKSARDKAEVTEIVTENAEALPPKKLSDAEETEHVKYKQCDQTFKSEKGLKIHIGKSHRTETILPTPEKVRCSSPMGELSMTLTPPLGVRKEQNESVLVKVSEEAIPLIKVAEKQDPEVSCIKDITDYQEMVNHLAWHYYNEFECNCLKCDPKRWEKIKLKKK